MVLELGLGLLESFVTIMNAAEYGKGIYNWFSGAKSGDQFIKEAVDELKRTRLEVQHLSDHILYCPGIQEVRKVHGVSSRLDNEKAIKKALDPITKALKSDILSTAIVSTPEKLKDAFTKNPWEVLMDVRPADRVSKPSNPDMVPVLFTDRDTSYIGWQMRGALPLLLGCDYSPADLRKQSRVIEPPPLIDQPAANLPITYFYPVEEWIGFFGERDEGTFYVYEDRFVFKGNKQKLIIPLTEVVDIEVGFLAVTIKTKQGNYNFSREAFEKSLTKRSKTALLRLFFSYLPRSKSLPHDRYGLLTKRSGRLIK